jgi:RHS repeat-associated protein
MARWRFASLTLTLSLAAGCPTAPQAQSPGPQPSPPAGMDEAKGAAPPQVDPGQYHTRPAVDPDSPSDEQDPLAAFSGAGPLLGRFEGFSDRGSEGTRSYKKGRLETVVLDGRSVQFAYDDSGRVAKAEFDDGRVLTYSYEGPYVSESEVGASRGKPATIKRAYSMGSRLPSMYVTEGAAWLFGWKDGQLIQELGPRGQRSYAYDSLNRIKSWSDGSGKGVTLEREGAETRYLLPDGKEFTLVEDADGVLREARQGQATYAFEQPEGNLRAAKGPLATIRYGTDEERGRRSVETPWGKSLTEYDELTQRARWTETPAGTFEFSYAKGKRSELRYPNGVVTRYRYREGRDLVRIESQVLDLDRRYDGRGRLVSERRDGAEAESRYGYDAFGRLDKLREQGQARVYRYDDAGSRVELAQVPGERVVEEHSENLALQRRVLLRKETGPQGKSSWKVAEVLRTYRSDLSGRLLEIKPNQGQSDRFSYDGAGRLEVVQRAGREQVRYAYDPLGRIASRTQGEGAQARVTRYVYDGPRLLAEIGPGSGLRVYAHGPDLDEPLAYRDGDGPWIFLHGDERGTVLAYSDAEGQAVDKVRFDAFGVLTEEPEGDRPLFFAGHRYDAEARLVLARARAYDPELNRFLGPDPAGVRDGVNPFAYAKGNPLRFVDPLGLWATPTTVRSHYGTLSPQAQLLLLQRVSGLRMAPSPKAPVLNLFKRFLPDLQLTTEGDEGETRTGRGPAVDLVEQLAAAESYEEAQELMASPLAEAAREELSGYEFKFIQGVASVEDDEARTQDSGLLRELLAPTRDERDAGGRLARQGDLTMQFLDKYLGVKSPEFLRRGMAALVQNAAVIKRRELLGTRAHELAELDEVELAEALAALDAIATPLNLSAAPVKPAAGAPERGVSRSTFAKAAAKAERYSSAGDERRAYAKARQRQSELWRQHARDLASPVAVRRALRSDSDLKSPEDLFEKLAQEDRQAARAVSQAEIAFRRALVQPLGYAEAYRRIAKDTSLFDGVNTVQLLRESMPIGKEEALQGRIEKFTRLKAQIKEAKRPSYAARTASLRKAIAAEERVVAERERQRAELAAGNARRAAKRRARRGRARGITLPGERVAPRPSGISLAVNQGRRGQQRQVASAVRGSKRGSARAKRGRRSKRGGVTRGRRGRRAGLTGALRR